MRSLPHLSRWTRTTALLFATSWVVACGDQVTQLDPNAFPVRAAAGGNGNGKGGGGGAGPKVRAVDPAGAPQGTDLNVRVFGSGYDATSDVVMLLDGVATGDITTNSTTFVSDTELSADISIAPDAVTNFYDVEVTAAGGKRGVGIEKFEVFGGADILMTAIGGIETPPADPPQLGHVSTDIAQRLFIEMGLIESKLNFHAALAAFGDGECTNPSGDPTGLEANFTDLAGQDGDDDDDGYGTRVVNISYDRTSSTDENRIFTLGGGGVRLTLGTFQDALPLSSPLTVDFVDDNPSDGDSVTGTYTYSGGAIWVERFTQKGPPKNYGRLVCPNGDDVMITLTRP